MSAKPFVFDTDVLIIGGGFSGSWAALTARQHVENVLIVDKGPRDWGGLGGMSGGDMIVKQPEFAAKDLVEELVYYYDGLCEQDVLEEILNQSYERFKDYEKMGHEFARDDSGRLMSIPQRGLKLMRYYFYHPYGKGGAHTTQILNAELQRLNVQRLGRIERQGNMNAEVEAYRYVTEGTFDAYLYQLVEGKQRFIAQVMTSKSPVRTAADVDEAALSYAELKALATGNPLVKERMGLDVEVSRLRMLKADHLAQKYALEDKAAKDYPQRMASLSARLESLEADAAKARANPPPTKEAFSMEVRGTAFRERAAAGEAVLAARGEMTETGAMPLGSYRGFSLELTFDRMSAAFEMRIVGEAEHKCELGGDAAGAVTRLDNAIAKMGAEADECRARLEEARRQMEAARTEATKPFPHEGELKEKSARLAELDALLDVGKSGPEQLCDDGHEPERAEKKKEFER